MHVRRGHVLQCGELIGCTTRQVCFVHGYRYARLSRQSDEHVQRPRLGPYHVEVLDFSPHAIYSFRQRDLAATEHVLEDGTRQTLISRLSILNNQFLFRKTIMSSLPYVMVTTGKKYLTEGVMIGDSSLILSRVSDAEPDRSECGRHHLTERCAERHRRKAMGMARSGRR